MPLAAASVLNSFSHASKFPPQAAACAADIVAATRTPAANELKKGRKFIMSPLRKRFADKKVAPADEMSGPTAAKTRLRVPDAERHSSCRSARSRDRTKHRALYGPGSAAHRFASATRCAASGAQSTPQRRREGVAVADAEFVGGADAIGIGDIELRQIDLAR